MLRTYWNRLGSLREADFVAGCVMLVDHEQWFPAIATIREYTQQAARERIAHEKHLEQRREFHELGARHGIRKLCDVQAKLAPFRNPDGSLDMEAFYRHSRELRGLDPDIDARPGHVPGWKSVGQLTFPIATDD